MVGGTETPMTYDPAYHAWREITINLIKEWFVSRFGTNNYWNIDFEVLETATGGSYTFTDNPIFEWRWR